MRISSIKDRVLLRGVQQKAFWIEKLPYTNLPNSTLNPPPQIEALKVSFRVMKHAAELRSGTNLRRCPFHRWVQLAASSRGLFLLHLPAHHVPQHSCPWLTAVAHSRTHISQAAQTSGLIALLIAQLSAGCCNSPGAPGGVEIALSLALPTRSAYNWRAIKWDAGPRAQTSASCTS